MCFDGGAMDNNFDNDIKQLQDVFDDEKEQLKQTLSIIEDEIDSTNKRIEENRKQYQQSLISKEKRYALESLEKDENNLKVLQSVYASPYHKKVSTQCVNHSNDEEKLFYVGKDDLFYKGNRLIYGWRFELAFLSNIEVNPKFSIKIDYSRRHYRANYIRRFDIKNGELLKVYPDIILGPSEEQEVVDQFLLDVLREKRDVPQITNIIKTIQRKQREIIVLPLKTDLVVQGVAGSGKTMILFHRLSYLLYHHEALKPEDVQIVVPNLKFVDQMQPLIKDLTIDKTPIDTVFGFYRKMLKMYHYNLSFEHSKFNNDQLMYSEYASKFMDIDIIKFYFENNFKLLFADSNLEKLTEIVGVFRSIVSFNYNSELQYENIKIYIQKILPLLSRLEVYTAEYNQREFLKNNENNIIKDFINSIQAKKQMYQERIEKFNEENDKLIRFAWTLRSFVQEIKLDMSDKPKDYLYLDPTKFYETKVFLESKGLVFDHPENTLLIKINDKQREKNTNNSRIRIKLNEPAQVVYRELLEKFRIKYNENNITINSAIRMISKIEYMENKLNDNEHDFNPVYYEDILDLDSKIVKNFENLKLLSEPMKFKLQNENEQLILDEFGYSKEMIKDYKSFLEETRSNLEDPDYLIGILLNYFKVEFNPRYRDHLYVLLAMLDYLFKGRKLRNHIQAIFIDEAQDFSHSEYMLINKVFGYVTYNLYGDLNQSLNKNINITNWNQIGKTEFHFSEVSENYRNTIEITQYTNQNLKLKMVPIGLNGVVPSIVSFDDLTNHLNQLKDHMHENRVAFIASQLNTFVINETLKGIHDGELQYEVIDVLQSKGLEFEIVFVCEDGMSTEEKYISYTRALNELYILKLD